MPLSGAPNKISMGFHFCSTFILDTLKHFADVQHSHDDTLMAACATPVSQCSIAESCEP